MLLKTARTAKKRGGGAVADSAVKTGESVKEVISDVTAKLTEIAKNSPKVIKPEEQEKLTREDEEYWSKIIQAGQTERVERAVADSEVKTEESMEEAIADFTSRLMEIAKNSPQIIKSQEQQKLTREEVDEYWNKIVQEGQIDHK